MTKEANGSCTLQLCFAFKFFALFHFSHTDLGGIYALEPLLKAYSVDIAIWAHQHDYQRYWPMYNFTVMNGTLNDPYKNAKFPIHIVSGAGVNCNDSNIIFYI